MWAGKGRRSGNTIATPRSAGDRDASRRARRWRSVPCRPPVVSSSPATMRRSVDFPQPEGPTKTQNSPSSISRSTPWITCVRAVALDHIIFEFQPDILRSLQCLVLFRRLVGEAPVLRLGPRWPRTAGAAPQMPREAVQIGASAVVDVTDTAPRTRPDGVRIGTAMQMMPGSLLFVVEGVTRGRGSRTTRGAFASDVVIVLPVKECHDCCCSTGASSVSGKWASIALPTPVAIGGPDLARLGIHGDRFAGVALVHVKHLPPSSCARCTVSPVSRLSRSTMRDARWVPATRLPRRMGQPHEPEAGRA